MTEQNTTRRHTQMVRMKELAEIHPLAYTLAFAWLAGVGDINKELGERVDDAIDYVERTYSND